ncbi:hypothetical protein EC1011_4232 [Escherichia coli 101-1]|nr:hypothetical protein EC1011_4232 [Escherichia coli 101-1]
MRLSSCSIAAFSDSRMMVSFSRVGGCAVSFCSVLAATLPSAG